MSSTLRRGPVLVTGGAGFIGANLVDRLAREGEDVIVFDALARPGVERNLEWLRERHPKSVTEIIGDVRDRDAVAVACADCKAVFHFAAQVAVTTSLVDPHMDFCVNVEGTLNVLEALRRREQPIPLLFASTNKVYGDLGDVPLELVDGAYRPTDAGLRATGIGEGRPLDFHTPYGCSKGAADQYVLDYARSYGVPTAVLRMSCVYGERQMGTEDQGWVAHFLISALLEQPITIYGDGHQVRDILDVRDAVAAYVGAWRNIDKVKGQAFNLGGGPRNAVSLRQVIDAIAGHTGRPVDLRTSDWRAGDQRYYVSDTRRFEAAAGWRAKTDVPRGIERLARWLCDVRGLSQPAAAREEVYA